MSAGATIRAYIQRPGAAVRLFCFPAAGTGASFFGQLAQALPAGIEACGIEYPGRGARSLEQAADRIDALVDEIGRGLQAFADKPFAFLGYSMGALVCYELARVLGPRKRQPEHVFLAAARAPRVPKRSPISPLPDGEFLEEVRRYGGIPPEILEDPALLQRSLAVLRADFALCEGYRAEEGEPLRCPLTVLGGQNDASVPLEALEAWSSYAGQSFSSRIFAGDHFFLRREPSAVAALLARELAPFLGEAEAPQASQAAPAPNKRAALAQLLRARLDRSRSFPLSGAQREWWLEQQMDPASAALNVPLVFRVGAELSPPLLTRTLELLTERHPMLRTVFVKGPDGAVRQQARPARAASLPVRELPDGGAEAAFELSRKQAALPFDLGSGPPLRFEVARVGPREFFFLLTLHRILLDRASIATLRREIGVVYESLKHQVEPTLAPAGATYEEFVERERDAAEAPGAASVYWKHRLEGAPARLALPGARPRAAGRAHRAGSTGRVLGEALAGSLRQLGRRERTSLPNVLLAALYALLHRSTGETDIVLGATCPHPEERGGALGLFGTVLPMRARLSGHLPFAELLRQVAEGVREARSQAWLPLSKPAGFRRPLQVAFHADEVADGANEPEAVVLAAGVNAFAKAELAFDISGLGGGLFLLAEYDAEVWDKQAVDAMAARYEELLHLFGADSGASVGDASGFGELRRFAC